MRTSVIAWFSLMMMVLAACSQHSSSQTSVEAIPSKAGRLASEKTIYLRMERGLMGNDFEILSSTSRRRALAAEYRALEYGKTGQTIGWQGEEEATSGEVTSGQPYRVGTQNCRQYRHNFAINGDWHTVSGSACRNEDGSWSPLS